MKPLKYLVATGFVLLVIALLSVAPFSQNLYSAEKQYTFSQVLSAGDQVGLDTFPQGTRIIVAPDEAYWRNSERPEDGFDRGVVTGVYDDYVTIRIANQGTIDPLTPQGKAKLVHLPASAISRIVTFTRVN